MERRLSQYDPTLLPHSMLYPPPSLYVVLPHSMLYPPPPCSPTSISHSSLPGECRSITVWPQHCRPSVCFLRAEESFESTLVKESTHVQDNKYSYFLHLFPSPPSSPLPVLTSSLSSPFPLLTSSLSSPLPLLTPSPSSLCTVSISFCKSAVTGPRSFRLEDLVGREGSGERQRGHAVGLHHRCARTTSVFHVLAGLLVAAEQVWGYLMLPATRGQQECQESGYHPGLRRRGTLRGPG